MTNGALAVPRWRVALAILALGLVVAVLAGALETLSTAAAGWAGGFRWVSRDHLWMSPISWSMVLLPLAGASALVSLVLRHRWWLTLSVFGLSVVAAFGLLLPWPQISRIAALMLAAGIAFQVARAAHQHHAAWIRRAPALALFGCLVVGVAAFAMPWWRARAATRQSANLPRAASGAPNVLLVVLDAARARSMGVTNAAMHTTPHLNDWAKTMTVFEHAFSAAPWTLPSHASMMSGRWALDDRADWTVPADRTHPVLPELFAAAGYRTGAFVGNLHYVAWDSGIERGFQTMDDYDRSASTIGLASAWMQTNLADTIRRAPTTGNVLQAFRSPDLSIIPQRRYTARLAGEIVDAFLRWEETPTGRPFFALVNVMDPHLNTLADSTSRRRYPHDERGEREYLASITYLDGELHRLLTALKARGVLDSTLVIVTGDHGELLNQHGMSGHSQSVYLDVLHVPLLMRLPGKVPENARIARPVTLRDLARTVQDLGALPGPPLPGYSLAALFRDSTAAVSPAIAEVRQQPNPLGDYPTASGALTAIFSDAWYYIKNHGTGREELYHFAVDSAEVSNMALTTDSAALLAPWRAQLEAHRKR